MDVLEAEKLEGSSDHAVAVSVSQGEEAPSSEAVQQQEAQRIDSVEEQPPAYESDGSLDTEGRADSDGDDGNDSSNEHGDDADDGDDDGDGDDDKEERGAVVSDDEDDVMKRRRAADDDKDDPHNLVERFIDTHAVHFKRALKEIKAGMKCSCWSWYIYPTDPWIVNGYERGSYTNKYYSLRSDEQAIAYLSFERRGINLRQNLIDIWVATEEALDRGVTFRNLLGVLDDPKARSSLKFFERISRQIGDTEVNTLLARVMVKLGEKPQDYVKPKKKDKKRERL